MNKQRFLSKYYKNTHTDINSLCIRLYRKVNYWLCGVAIWVATGHIIIINKNAIGVPTCCPSNVITNSSVCKCLTVIILFLRLEYISQYTSKNVESFILIAVGTGNSRGHDHGR